MSDAGLDPDNHVAVVRELLRAPEVSVFGSLLNGDKRRSGIFCFYLFDVLGRDLNEVHRVNKHELVISRVHGLTDLRKVAEVRKIQPRVIHCELDYLLL